MYKIDMYVVLLSFPLLPGLNSNFGDYMKSSRFCSSTEIIQKVSIIVLNQDCISERS